MKLFVLTIVVTDDQSEPPLVEVSAHLTAAAAKAKLGDYARSMWPLESPPPASNARCVSAYFKHVPHEYWQIDELDVALSCSQ